MCWTAGWPNTIPKNNVALAHLYYEKSCSKFGLIPLSVLGEDSMMDRLIDIGWMEK